MPQGTLFTKDFLHEGIRGTEAWRSISPEALAAFGKALQAIVKEVADPARLNEAQTEDRIVKPILERRPSRARHASVPISLATFPQNISIA